MCNEAYVTYGVGHRSTDKKLNSEIYCKLQNNLVKCVMHFTQARIGYIKIRYNSDMDEVKIVLLARGSML